MLACLTSQQQASVSQGRICSDNFTCCHTEIEVADQTFYLTQSPGRPVPVLTLKRQAPGRVATGVPIVKSLVDSTRKNPVASGIRTPDLPLSKWTSQPLGHRGGLPELNHSFLLHLPYRDHSHFPYRDHSFSLDLPDGDHGSPLNYLMETTVPL